MPFPWKKKSRSSSARISRLVADLQSPPKRGGSLVVETGFPTSLIDLFVKNRDRLKKKSKPSHVRHKPGDVDPTALDPPPTRGPRPEDHAAAPAVTQSANIPEAPVKGAVAITQAEGADAAGTVEGVPYRKGPDGCRRNRFSLAVWKVFALVVFALCTKGLVMGISISTVVLLLLEQVSKEIPSFSKRRAMSGRVREIRDYRSKKEAFILEGTEEWHFREEEKGDQGRSDSISPAEAADECCEPEGEIEIEILEPEDDNLVPIPDPVLLRREGRWGSLDVEGEPKAKARGIGEQCAKKKSKIKKRIIVPMF